MALANVTICQPSGRFEATCGECGEPIERFIVDQTTEQIDSSSFRVTARSERVEPCGHSHHAGGEHNNPERKVMDYTLGGVVLVDP